MIDMDSVTFTVAAFGSVTLGTLVFYIMNLVKGWFPSLEGRAAEGAVTGVSLVAVLLVLWAGDTNWRDNHTYLALIVGTLATTMVARGVYATLYKVSVPGVPPSAEAEAVAVDDPAADRPEFGWRRGR